MTTRLIDAVTGTLFLAAAFSAGAAEDHHEKTGANNVLPTTVLVRAHKLTGEDEFGRSRVLFSSEYGVLLTTTDLTSISKHLNPKQQPVPEGTYKSLRLELSNEAFIYGTPGGPVVTRLRNDGAQEVVTMSGAIRVAGGEVLGLALSVNSWRDSDH